MADFLQTVQPFCNKQLIILIYSRKLSSHEHHSKIKIRNYIKKNNIKDRLRSIITFYEIDLIYL